MKTNLKKAAWVIGMLTLAITGCKQEGIVQNPALTNSNSEIQSMANQTETSNEAIAISYDVTLGEILAENDGLADDYLVESADFSSDPNGAPNGPRSGIRNHSFLRCLHGLMLDSIQVKDLRSALINYQSCKVSSMQKGKEIHQRLRAKYKALVEEQMRLLKSNSITKTEFDKRMDRLRTAFRNELRDSQIRDKVRENLKDCHIRFLKETRNILTDAQWAAFVDCYKN